MKIKITCRPRYNPWLKKYLNTKTFSKMLAFGILLNSIPINSFAGILSEDGRYETFEGSDITVNEVLEEDKVDVEIEGNTMVNLIPEGSRYDANYPNNNPDNLTVTKSTNCVEINMPSALTQYLYYAITLDMNRLKPNSKYTLVCDTKQVNFLSLCSGDRSQIVSNDVSIETGEGLKKVVVTTKDFSNVDGTKDIYFYARISLGTSGKSYFKNAILLEGDWTNRELPPYFEGMKSVGQDDTNGHNIEILSENKNMLNVELINETGGTNAANGQLYPNMFMYNETRCRTKNFIKVKPNTDYYFSSNNKFDFVIVEFDKNNIQILDTNWTLGQEFLYRTSSQCENIIIIVRKLDNSVIAPEDVVGHLQMIPYSTNMIDKKEVKLNEPLRGLPNGVKDKIIKRNGQWVVERNCSEIIIDGTQAGVLITQAPQDVIHFGIHLKLAKTNQRGNNSPITDKLPRNTNADTINDNFEGAYIESTKDLRLMISKSKLQAVDKNGVIAYLSKNPIKVIYQLETPIYEPLKIEPTLNTYIGTTHIFNDSVIPANIKVTVDRVLNRASEAIALAKTNPTVENLSRARMWVNLLKESNKKDELQEEIGSITNIDDMVLDRKTASANLDIYIKCENMLSMSLDTNQISFEDFSGIEDMEKINAVNLTINSSLPYQLNAYLPNEIQNADRTKTMNKEILQLKESNETTYQAFTNTTDKVVLKDNCNSGNQLVHGIDIMLKGGIAHEKDVYKAVIKLEAEQK